MPRWPRRVIYCALPIGNNIFKRKLLAVNNLVKPPTVRCLDPESSAARLNNNATSKTSQPTAVESLLTRQRMHSFSSLGVVTNRMAKTSCRVVSRAVTRPASCCKTRTTNMNREDGGSWKFFWGVNGARSAKSEMALLSAFYLSEMEICPALSKVSVTHDFVDRRDQQSSRASGHRS